MIDDQTERAWWRFDLPGGTVSWAPGNTEADARAVVRTNSYEKAPVDAWPCTRSRWTSRAALVATLIRSADKP